MISSNQIPGEDTQRRTWISWVYHIAEPYNMDVTFQHQLALLNVFAVIFMLCLTLSNVKTTNWCPNVIAFSYLGTWLCWTPCTSAEGVRSLRNGRIPWGTDFMLKTLRDSDGHLEGRLITLNWESLRLFLAPEVFTCPCVPAGLLSWPLDSPLSLKSLWGVAHCTKVSPTLPTASVFPAVEMLFE